MARGAGTFKEADLRKALTAARKAKVRIRVEIEAGNKLAVIMIGDEETIEAPARKNSWDEVLDD